MEQFYRSFPRNSKCNLSYNFLPVDIIKCMYFFIQLSKITKKKLCMLHHKYKKFTEQNFQIYMYSKVMTFIHLHQSSDVKYKSCASLQMLPTQDRLEFPQGSQTYIVLSYGNASGYFRELLSLEHLERFCTVQRLYDL